MWAARLPSHAQRRRAGGALGRPGLRAAPAHSEGPGVSTQYEGRDETCPVSTKKGGGGRAALRGARATRHHRRARRAMQREVGWPAWRRGRDEACPVSTGGGTRRVQLVREGRGGGEGPAAPRSDARRGARARERTAPKPGRVTRPSCPSVACARARRVRLVRGEGRRVPDQYGVRDAACPLSTGGGGGHRVVGDDEGILERIDVRLREAALVHSVRGEGRDLSG